MRRALFSALALALAFTTLAACGETRRPIGDECLRSDDCLSGVCSSRTCVSAPPLVSGVGPPPADEIPSVPIVDAGDASTSADAREGG
jgi:hypothetical protein